MKKGHYTGEILGNDAVMVGGLIPGSKFTGLDIPNHHDARKRHQQDFDDMQANCNTCANLKRIPSGKSKYGFLYGELTEYCRPATVLDGNSVPAVSGNVIMFHPHDCLGMGCYKPRDPTNGRDMRSKLLHSSAINNGALT